MVWYPFLPSFDHGKTFVCTIQFNFFAHINIGICQIGDDLNEETLSVSI